MWWNRMKDQVVSKQRNLRQEGLDEVEIGFELGTEINPEFKKGGLTLVDSMAGEGSQAIPTAHCSLTENARFVRHWDPESNNGYETSLEDLYAKNPNFFVDPRNDYADIRLKGERPR
jgi:hypothetical protein